MKMQPEPGELVVLLHILTKHLGKEISNTGRAQSCWRISLCVSVQRGLEWLMVQS